MAGKLSHNGLIELKVKAGDPRETYAGLLWVQRRQGYAFGWVAHKFRAIFGKWPRPQSKVEPVAPNMELREWLGIMNTRFRAKKKREELKREAAVAELEANDMVASFMTPEDWEVRL
jgi:hypothetical protein